MLRILIIFKDFKYRNGLKIEIEIANACSYLEKQKIIHRWIIANIFLINLISIK